MEKQEYKFKYLYEEKKAVCKSLQESYHFINKLHDDEELWYDDMTDLSNEYFAKNKKETGFVNLVKFAQAIKARKAKPTSVNWEKFKALIASLPDTYPYKPLKAFVERIDPTTYKREFRYFADKPVSLVASVFSSFSQAVLYFESENFKDNLEAEGIDKEYIDGVVEWMEKENLCIDDITVEGSGNYGYGVEISGGGVTLSFMTDSEADDCAMESAKSLIDESGITGISGWESYIDSSWFKDTLKESNEIYASDIESEGDSTYENRLVKECYDNGLIDDDDFEKDEDGEPDYSNCNVDSSDLSDKLAEYLTDQENDPVDWYRSNFGDEALEKVVKDNNLYDVDEVAQNIVDEDGRGILLASADNNELEFADIFAYRTN